MRVSEVLSVFNHMSSTAGAVQLLSSTLYQLMSDASCGMSCHNVALSQRLCQTVAHCMRGISWCHTMHARCKSHQLMLVTACAGDQLLSDTTCMVSVLGTHMHARCQLLSPNACAVSAYVKHCMHDIGSCHTLHVLCQPCQTLHAPYLLASVGVTYGMHDNILLLDSACVVTECTSYGHPPHTYLLSSTTRTSCFRTLCMRGITLLSCTLCMRAISCCSTLHGRCQFSLSTASAVSVAVTQGMCNIRWLHALHAMQPHQLLMSPIACWGHYK
jgi:hypothetical protein